MSHSTPHFSQSQQRLTGVKHIIAVGSGKGGVGKSTTSINLAVSLQQQGLRVGLLDTDIYGPNQPQMLGIRSKPDLIDNRFKPIIAHELQTMSLGYLIEDETPLVWRGPMVSKMLQQLLYQTAWDALDVLLLDLPPGTGDVQLTLAKKVPLSGAIIVTTPQTVATQDAQKGLAMFRKVDVNILGVIENMSQHTCSQCGHTEAIFGEHGGIALAQEHQVPLLGQLPLLRELRESADDGLPFVLSHPDSKATETYHHIASQLKQPLASIEKKRRSDFPQIVVE